MADPTALAVHRCRFVDFSPSAITALAFPPLPLPSAKGKSTRYGRQPLKFGTLAVGHANGNIDLCEWSGEPYSASSQAWVIRKTLSGLYPSKVDSIAFVIRHPDDFGQDAVPSCSDLRLFSSGGGSELLEWDIDRACVRRTISSQGGSIWCISANPASTFLALGCEDGTVRLLSLAHDTLTHHRRFDRVKCRVLSIAWGPPLPRQYSKEATEAEVDDNDDEDESDDWSDAWLVTGGSDSSIRKWDVASGRVIDRMGTDKIRGERTLVWAVGVLGDGTIVSGDSLGMVKFWDSKTCTQMQSFQGHGADVLCLTIGPDGETVYSSGVDQKTIQYSLIKTAKAEKGPGSVIHSSSRWVQTSSRRMHSHDVRALTIWPPYTPMPLSHKRQFPFDIAPLLASGGLDMSVVVTPAALPKSTIVKVINPLSTSTESTFEDSYHRRLAYTTGPSSTSAICIARQARLVSCIRDSGLSIWRILTTQDPSDEEYLEDDMQENSQKGGWEKVLEMEFNVQTNLVASGISDDGRWLVVSDLYETKLFSLHTDSKGQLNTKRIRDFSSILQAHSPPSISSTGGLAFHFTPDSSKLVMTTAMTSYVVIIDLTGEKPRVLRRFDHHRVRQSVVHGRVIKGKKNDEVEAEAGVDSANESEDETDTTPNIVAILRIAISPDGQWLVTSDDHTRTHVFNLDSIQHHSILPSFVQPAQAIAFDPSQPSTLIMAFPDNSLQIYDVESRQFPTWSKNIVDNLPKRFTYAHDPIMGMAFDQTASTASQGMAASPRYALFWGSTWMCKLPLSDSITKSGGFNKKRPREPIKSSSDDQSREFRLITHYRPLLFVDFLAAGELLVVERPLVDILSTLPPAYFKHKYGAS